MNYTTLMPTPCPMCGGRRVEHGFIWDYAPLDLEPRREMQGWACQECKYEMHEASHG